MLSTCAPVYSPASFTNSWNHPYAFRHLSTSPSCGVLGTSSVSAGSIRLRTGKMPVATSWHRFFHVSRSLVISWHSTFQPSWSFITASICFLALTFITGNRQAIKMSYHNKIRRATKVSKGVWKIYFLVPLSSWSCGPRAMTGRALVFYCPPSGDHTPRPHDCSPLGDGLLRLLSLHYNCYYQQRNNTCHALIVIK